ncbi:MAG: single-stranded DNA-binding protein [Firmicutes bacterium]|nr:single-stranded DNA-binding protein [Bacillota bacterium]
MNKVILMGRLTRDAELRYSSGSSGTAVCRYSIAVNRSYKRDGEPDADFFNIVAFANRAEFAGKYFKKGMMVAVVGELRNGSYTDKDGNKRYTTDVIVSEQYFAESRASFESRSQNYGGGYQNQQQYAAPAPNPQDFAPADQGYAQAPQQAPQNYQQQAPAQNYQSAPAQNYQQNPAPQSAPADGFMPIDNDIEGDEDLPF